MIFNVGMLSYCGEIRATFTADPAVVDLARFVACFDAEAEALLLGGGDDDDDGDDGTRV